MQNLFEQESYYLNLLAKDNNNLAALHFLGLLNLKKNNLEEARKYFTHASQISENNLKAIYGLGRCYEESQMTDSAIDNYKQIISRDKSYKQAYLQLAKLYRKNKEYDNSLEYFNLGLSVFPNDISFLNGLATVYQELKEYTMALDYLNKSIEIDKTKPELFLNRGHLYKTLKDDSKSLADYEFAFILDNKNIDTQVFILDCLIEKFKYDEAKKRIQYFLTINPNSDKIYSKIAQIYFYQKDYQKAKHFIQKCLSLNNQNIEVKLILSQIFLEEKNEKMALKIIDELLLIDPTKIEYNFQKAKLLYHLKNYLESIFFFEKAIQLSENFPTKIVYQYLVLKNEICDWRNYEEDFKLLIKCIDTYQEEKQLHSQLSPLASCFYDLPIEHVNTIFESYSKAILENLNRFNLHDDFEYKIGQNKRIKVAYISPDFNSHPVSFLIKDLFKSHNKEQFEIFAFHLNNKNDDYTATIKKDAEHFIDVSNKSSREILDIIRKYDIDIAIDLASYTTFSKPELFAARVAPIQISYVGLWNSTGASFYDFTFVDEIIAANGLEKYYKENLIYFPISPFINSELEKSQKVLSRKDYNIPEDKFVFANMNTSRKYNPELFDIWAEIINKTENSILWLHSNNQQIVKDNLSNELIQRGINSDRVFFMDSIPIQEHWKRFELADIFLDTNYYNGHSTTMESLRNGLPVLTLQGKIQNSRVASSILNSAGLDELITHSKEEYIDKAIKLCNDKNYFQEIKNILHINLKTNNFFNTKYMVSLLEKSFIKILDTYKNQLPFESFKLEA